MEFDTHVFFDSSSPVYLIEGIVYYNTTKLFSIETATYDTNYIESLVDQYKRHMRSIPFDLSVYGIKYIEKDKHYQLITSEQMYRDLYDTMSNPNELKYEFFIGKNHT